MFVYKCMTVSVNKASLVSLMVRIRRFLPMNLRPTYIIDRFKGIKLISF